MEILLYAGLAMAVFALLSSFFGHHPGKIKSVKGKYKLKYTYTRKQFIMSKAENNFYKVLQQAVGTSYMIFPQVHLSTFLSHATRGQDYRAALNVIQRKSVDFLICNREYYNPMVAIELDDSSPQYAGS